MSDAWKLLVDLGLPDGAIRPPPHGPFDDNAVRAAVLEVAPNVTGAKVAPLLAWLRAWQHHWGPSFVRVFGAEPGFVAELDERLDDENRFLKLRRIAIENLSHIL